MVNSSLRNAMARRNHKERAQPLHRQRLGLLEKHKDYVLRARDYKSKQDRLQRLREKAAFRNKDEFYWGMVKSKTSGGVAVVDRGNESLNTDLVKLLKTQDAGYLRVQIAKDEKRITRLRAELEVSAPSASGSSSSAEWDAAAELAEVERLAKMGLVVRPIEQDRDVISRKGNGKETVKRKGKGKDTLPKGHVVFVDGKEEFETYGSIPDAPELEEEVEAVDLGWAEPIETKRAKKRSTSTSADSVGQSKTASKSAATDDDDDDDDDANEAEMRAHRLELLTEISSLLARVRLLRQAESKLSTTKNLMGKGSARKVREAGFVEDESQPEDRNGERKRFQGKMWKWKLERRK